MEYSDSEKQGFPLVSLLFGNIDENGELEDNILDEKSKQQLPSLFRFGLESVVKEVVGEEYEDLEKTADGDFNEECSPSAVDYADITELAEDSSSSVEMTNSCSVGINTEVDGDSGISLSEMSDTLPPLVPCGRGSSPATESSSSPKQKLETPLAAIRPSKYANVDVKELFPDFDPNKVPRFSRLFRTEKNAGSRWKGFKKRRKRRKMQEQIHSDDETDTGNYKNDFSLNFAPPPSPSKIRNPELEMFLQEAIDQIDKEKQKDDSSDEAPKIAPWRYGPSQYWYDMLGVPPDGSGFDYGFKIKVKTEEDLKREKKHLEDLYNDIIEHDDKYLLITQKNWEEDIIWDGDKVKDEILANLDDRAKAAGWIPTSSNRVANVNFNKKNIRTTSTWPATKNGKNCTNKASSKPGEEGDTFYSIFPPENEELLNGNWEDDIIWDAQAMDHMPEPKILTLDPTDENIILGIPDDVDPSKYKPDSSATTKVKIPHPHVKKSKILLGRAGVINVLEEDGPPSPSKSPNRFVYDYSGDDYYTTQASETSLKTATGSIIQHSIPALELRFPFVQTHMGPMRLRNFHRPPLKRFSHGKLAIAERHGVTSLTKYIKKKAKLREQERIECGGGDMFFMRTNEDLTGRDGTLILIEFCEEHPSLMNLVGMASKIKNYYKRKAAKDQDIPQYKYGEVAYAHTSPFLGMLLPGKSMQAFENNMYRAPIFEHTPRDTDFLVIRTRNEYFIREFDALFVAGQECPLYEVPSPNSKRANNFVRDFLQVFIYRLFWKSKGTPKRLCMDEVKRAFPSHSESSVRKRLKLCADFKRTGNDSNLWVLKCEFRLPPEDEIRNMVTPEQCCAHFSMMAAEQRLRDAGYGEKVLFVAQDDDEDEIQLKMDDEVKVAPWNSTRAYIQAMKGKCLLQLTGPADPTGCGEGFSYIRVPNKPTAKQSKEEQKQQPKRVVTGTDADLRRLSLDNAKALLRKFGLPEEEIKKLSRWEVIDVVRTLSTAKAKAGEEGMTKFSRGNRFSIAEHQERYKEECQRIFDLQNKVLGSNEVLSSEESESSNEENSDIEEMGKNIENMLANKKTSTQLTLEREEQERQELRKLLLGRSEETKKAKDKQRKPQEEETSLAKSSKKQVLKIMRTYRQLGGKYYTRLEVVKNPAIVDAYVKVKTKNPEYAKTCGAVDDAHKEEMKREKRRIQEQLRRIKRNQEKEKNGLFPFGSAALGQSLLKASGDKSGADKTSNLLAIRKKAPKIKPDLKVRCGACGATGHMRTNKACPQYNMPPAPVSVALTQEEEQEIGKELLIEDGEDLVNVEGTKIKLSGKLLKHAEDIKRRSLLLKVPKDAVARKRKASLETQHCDYLEKHKKSNRRITDPLVALSTILEDILNQLKNLEGATPFLHPVSLKAVPDYYKIVSRPMDLQTIKENIRQKKYQTREEFLADVNQIVENSTIYNGAKSYLTIAAKEMFELCVQKLGEKEEELMRLEKGINPLLDDDQVAMSFILSNILNSIKNIADYWAFAKPVNRKQVKDYYEKVKRPMDLETISNNIAAHKYHSRHEFLADVEQIVKNSIIYNGPESQITAKASNLLNAVRASVNEYSDHLKLLERKLKAHTEFEDLEEEVEDADWQLGESVEVPFELSTEVYEEPKFVDETEAPKTETHRILKDDLHFSSDDEDDAMMEEVQPIEIGTNEDENQVAEAMMQLGNFAYPTTSLQPVKFEDWTEEFGKGVELVQQESVDTVDLSPMAPNAASQEMSIMQQDLEISDSDEEEVSSQQIKKEVDVKESDNTDDGLWF